eukprot:TRINITY_DN27394_c0_g1_i3.p1 TRINITY_DN27394_c0_g1~~TRINITY_DN27394_c0_g1_i3.p1  ORF type:complete len:281 (+),score=49.55 TRINITY_DN27394_c0_g1_i3:25-867(+)
MHHEGVKFVQIRRNTTCSGINDKKKLQIKVQQQDENAKQAQEEEEEELKERTLKRAKIENIWQNLKTQTHSQLSSRKSKEIEQKMKDPGFTYLFALCNSNQQIGKNQKGQKRQLNQSTEGWMKNLGIGNDNKRGRKSQDLKSLASEALQKVKEAENGGKVKVIETRRFAGQQIQVEKQVEKDSKEAQEAQEKSQAPKSSLEVAVNMINQDKKITVVDKSRADWDGYKHENKEVNEELQNYKKSGDTYLDKQQFLVKADFKQYEKERDQRLAADIRTRGRL